MRFENDFLEKKYMDNSKLFHDICNSWSMNESKFSKKLDDWFFNFNTDEESCLGLKIIAEIKYISEDSFNKNLNRVFEKVRTKTSLYNNNEIVYLLPNDYIDSAFGLIYRASKIWDMTGEQVIMLKDLAQHNKQVYIAFNDTHGTGNQLVNHLKKVLETDHMMLNGKLLIIAGIVITDMAKSYISNQLSHIKDLKIEFISVINPLTADDIFSRKEYSLVEELGYDICPSYSLGYGNCGLLIAYHYQCPNNTIPIVWSKVNTENIIKDNRHRVWTPLFGYKSKNGETKNIDNNNRKKYTNIRKSFQLNDLELDKVNSIIEHWGCSDEKHNEIISNLGKWFSNFGIAHKDLAIYILEKLHYFSINRTRQTIKELKNLLIKKIGPSINRKDILLVLTGDNIESSYQYVYDFMRIWHLMPSQIITIDKFKNKPYEALDKHLVYFYHSRIHRGETFTMKVWPNVKQLPAASHNIMSIMLSDTTKLVFQNEIINKNPDKKISYFCDDEVSKTIANSFDKNMLNELKQFYADKFGKNLVVSKFLTAYYFKCPKDTLPLLWYDRVTIKGNTKKWHPLF